MQSSLEKRLRDRLKERDTPRKIDPNAERLVSVAIQRDGVVHARHKSHYELRMSMNPDDPDPRVGRMGDIEGFMTSQGRFVTRDEGRDVAVASGQLGKEWERGGRKLLSSDINW